MFIRLVKVKLNLNYGGNKIIFIKKEDDYLLFDMVV